MFSIIQKTIIAMALLRVLSGTIEIFAAFLIYQFNDVEKALLINGSLSLIGPVILILSMSVGLYSLADDLPIKKLTLIVLGVALILYGVKK